MTLDPIQAHFDEVSQRIRRQAIDPALRKPAKDFFARSHQLQYSYNFTWLGRPIIQYPQDIAAFQEVVSVSRPDLIIETGIAHGGSLVLSASLLCLLDVMDGLDPRMSPRKVVGVDIDIRSHNRRALDEHPLRCKMETALTIGGPSAQRVDVATPNQRLGGQVQHHFRLRLIHNVLQCL